MTKELTVRLNS